MFDAPALIAFQAGTRLAAGAARDVVAAAHRAVAGRDGAPLAVFTLETAQPVDLDLRGDLDAALDRLLVHPLLGPTIARAPSADDTGAPVAPTASADTRGAAAAPARRGPGRPRLGVVSREVTLLPRHWAWLAEQPGGASAALRRLVDAARLRDEPARRRRDAQEAAHRFLTAMAGDAPGYEEATRALYAGDLARFDRESASWPADVRAHARWLVERACV